MGKIALIIFIFVFSVLGVFCMGESANAAGITLFLNKPQTYNSATSVKTVCTSNPFVRVEGTLTIDANNSNPSGTASVDVLFDGAKIDTITVPSAWNPGTFSFFGNYTHPASAGFHTVGLRASLNLCRPDSTCGTASPHSCCSGGCCISYIATDEVFNSVLYSDCSCPFYSNPTPPNSYVSQDGVCISANDATPAPVNVTTDNCTTATGSEQKVIQDGVCIRGTVTNQRFPCEFHAINPNQDCPNTEDVVTTCGTYPANGNPAVVNVTKGVCVLNSDGATPCIAGQACKCVDKLAGAARDCGVAISWYSPSRYACANSWQPGEKQQNNSCINAGCSEECPVSQPDCLDNEDVMPDLCAHNTDKCPTAPNTIYCEARCGFDEPVIPYTDCRLDEPANFGGNAFCGSADTKAGPNCGWFVWQGEVYGENDGQPMNDTYMGESTSAFGLVKTLWCPRCKNANSDLEESDCTNVSTWNVLITPCDGKYKRVWPDVCDGKNIKEHYHACICTDPKEMTPAFTTETDRYDVVRTCPNYDIPGGFTCIDNNLYSLTYFGDGECYIVADIGVCGTGFRLVYTKIGSCATACTTNADCSGGQTCVNGSCTTTIVCTNNAGCPSGQNCVSGSCIPNSCTTSANCASGQNCIGGSCTPASCNFTNLVSVQQGGNATFNLTYTGLGGTPTSITPTCGDGATLGVHSCNASGCTFTCNNYTGAVGPYAVSAQIRKGTATVQCSTAVTVTNGSCAITGPTSVQQNGNATFNLTYTGMGLTGTPSFSSGTPICGYGATLSGQPVCTVYGCTFTCNNYTTIGGPFTVFASIQNGSATATCNTQINVGVCGNGVVDPGEQCEPPNASTSYPGSGCNNHPDRCSNLCKCPVATGTCTVTPANPTIALGDSPAFTLTYRNMGTSLAPTFYGTPSCGNGIPAVIGNCTGIGSGSCVLNCGPYSSAIGSPFAVSAPLVNGTTYAQCNTQVNVGVTLPPEVNEVNDTNYPLNVHSSLETSGVFDPYYCQGGLNLKWNYSDNNNPVNSETKYDFQITSALNGFPIPETSECPIPCWRNVDGEPKALQLEHFTVGTEFPYDTKYYWRVKVYNSVTDSGWYYGPPFTTPLHAYPFADFGVSPVSKVLPLTNGKAEFSFTNISKCYDNSDQETPCHDYLWNFGDMGSPTNTSTNINTPHIYTTTLPPTKTVKLITTDDAGYSCDTSQDVKVKPPGNVPEWREISPF